MTHATGELLVQAPESASRLFDTLVDEALAGKDPAVAVTWAFTGETDDDGEQIESATTTIGGVDSVEYAKRILSYTTMNNGLVEATSQQFENLIGDLWEDVIGTYEELNMAVHGLATSREAGYFSQAKDRAAEQGMTGIGDGELIMTARQLVLADLAILHAADLAASEVD